jgi:phosphoadenosine phosphosulfate reductase
METALAFSGGKDSLACLMLYRDRLPEIDVIWANTGRNLPEVEAFVNRVAVLCPHWHEVKTDRAGQWAQYGLPSDLVPVDSTAFAQTMTSTKPIKVQSYLQCCFKNIAEPLFLKAKQLGAKTIIRGQRLDEAHRASVGVVDGIEIIHPIAEWSAERVMDFLRSTFGPLPDHYALEHSSVDCFDCTAYAAHAGDRARYMKARHPERFGEYMTRLAELSAEVARPLNAYRKLEACNG